MTIDSGSEDLVRTALRTATAHVVAPPHIATVVVTRARRHRRQRLAIAFAAVVLLVIGSAVPFLMSRHRVQSEVTIAPLPSPPPTAATVASSLNIQGPGTEFGTSAVGIYLRWLPESVVTAADESSPAVDQATKALLSPPFQYSSPSSALYALGGAGTEAFGAPDGHSGVMVEIISGATGADLNRLTLLYSQTNTFRFTTVNGHKALLVGGAGASRLYLAWSPQPDEIVAIGVTTPMFNEKDLRRIADGVVLGDPPPPAPGPGNRPAEDAVRAAYATAYWSLPNPRALSAVEGGTSLRGTLADLARLHPDVAKTLTFDINSILFTSPTRALVQATLNYYERSTGTINADVETTANWTPTGWKLSRTGYCAALAKLGVHCPGPARAS